VASPGSSRYANVTNYAGYSAARHENAKALRPYSIELRQEDFIGSNIPELSRTGGILN